MRCRWNDRAPVERLALVERMLAGVHLGLQVLQSLVDRQHAVLDHAGRTGVVILRVVVLRPEQLLQVLQALARLILEQPAQLGIHPAQLVSLARASLGQTVGEGVAPGEPSPRTHHGRVQDGVRDHVVLPVMLYIDPLRRLGEAGGDVVRDQSQRDVVRSDLPGLGQRGLDSALSCVQILVLGDRGEEDVRVVHRTHAEAAVVQVPDNLLPQVQVGT